MTTGERIKQARKQAGLRQNELARRIEVSPPTLSQVENSKRQPSLELLRRISSELQVDINDLAAVPQPVQQTSLKDVEQAIRSYRGISPNAKSVLVELLNLYHRDFDRSANTEGRNA